MSIPNTARRKIVSAGAYIEWKGEEYFLLNHEIDEFDKQDQDIEDDKEFDAWFEGFLKKKHIMPRKKYDFSSSDKGYKGYLSGWWQSDWHSAYKSPSGYTDDRRLALALSAVANTVRIVDDTDPPMSVSWSSDSNSYSDFENHRIVIDPTPLTSTKEGWADGDVIDVANGLALHEAGHCRHTRKVHKQMLVPNRLQPQVVAFFLANILEDIRTEALTGKEFPGFVPFLEKTRDWVWTVFPMHKIPKEWAVDSQVIDEDGKSVDMPALENCLNALVLHFKWSKQIAENDLMKSPSFDEEFPWWDDWCSRYLDEKINLRQAVIEGLDRLMHAGACPNASEEGEGEAGEGEEGEESEGRSHSAPESGTPRKECADKSKGHVGHQMDSLPDRTNIGETDDAESARDNDLPGTIQPCISDIEYKGRRNLDTEQADEINRLVEENLTELTDFQVAPGCAMPKIYRRTPRQDAYSKKEYIGKPAPIISRLRSVLRFRPELPQYTERLLNSGQIDEEELWRFGAEDYRVFQRQVIETYPNAHVGLLVDMSGSMVYANVPLGSSGRRQSKVKCAQEIAQLFVLAFNGMEGIKPYVWGHTGDIDGQSSAEFYEIWMPGDPLERLGLISSMEHGDNYDGYAIEWAGNELLDQGAPAEQRLLFVLSDGLPAGHGYGDSAAMMHVRSVTDNFEKKGLPVVQIAIDARLRPDEQGTMFRHWIPFTTYDGLPGELTKVLRHLLND